MATRSRRNCIMLSWCSARSCCTACCVSGMFINVLLLQLLPESTREFSCPGVYKRFIDCKQLALTHQPVACNHSRVDMVPIHSENQVPGKISTAQRRRRQVIQQHKIGCSAYAQFAHERE